MADSSLIIGVIGTIIILGALFLVLANKKKIPIVLPLLVLGIILGPVTKLFDPIKFSQVINVLVTFALVIVIFEAGNTVNLTRLKSQALVFTSLSLIGPLIIISIVSLFSYVFLNIRAELAILLGALLSSTDPTIMRPILESFGRKLENIKNIINLESMLNSVVAVVFVIVISNLLILKQRTGFAGAIKIFMYQIFLGVGMGVVFGYLIYRIICKFKEEVKTHILTLGAILLLYGVTNLVGGSGIISVLILGAIFANLKPAPPRIIKSFGGELELLLLIFVYVILGTFLGVELTFINVAIIFFVVILVLLSRYVAVYISASVKSRGERNILFLGGGKGVVCSVLALSSAPLFPNPELVLNIIFSVVLVTTLIASFVPIFFLDRLMK
ncbi:MAG: cation:proton antiporter [Candidatus Woesearchaeota archaeon]|nr:MAG: cation:proton antiporter [Candidatus Woesearchaeota archaeon]